MVYIVYSAERTKIHDNNSTKFQRQQIELMCLGVSTVVKHWFTHAHFMMSEEALKTKVLKKKTLTSKKLMRKH